MILQTVIFISLSVLFYVDKTLRDGEPRVWKELNAAWDAKFSCLPGGRPEWDGQRYGSILFGGELGDGTQMLTVQSMADPPQTVRTHIWPGMSFDFAISGESEVLGPGEENWLKDCLRFYRPPIDSLEKLLEVRAEMNLEGPR